eukprot:1140920-Pelagomonas_calceolata.AAC.4
MRCQARKQSEGEVPYGDVPPTPDICWCIPGGAPPEGHLRIPSSRPPHSFQQTFCVCVSLLSFLCRLFVSPR